jgi:nitroreductase/SAM-dependent methyltransferase
LHVNALRYRTEQNHQETRSLSLQQFNRSRWPIGARELLELIASRRSCRAFDGSEIDPETLRKIVIDGTQAPSSCNQQQWHFVIVTDRADLVRACEIAGGNPHFAECSALIYLCFQKGWAHDNYSVIQGVAAACYHMMISAHLRGLSSIWNAGIGDHAKLHEMLGIPINFEIIGALAIGRAKATAPRIKAPRRDPQTIMSFDRFVRPAETIYPVKPAPDYPYHEISKAWNPFAEWDPEAWSWAQLADFRGFSVWAKSPIPGVYYSRRQGDATARELDLLPLLEDHAKVVEFLPWGGTSTVALRRRLPKDVLLQVVELSEHNLTFIRERLNQEDLGDLPTEFLTMPGPQVPLPDQHADVVVFLQSLEHMRDRPAVLAEARRILKPNGVLIVSARNLTSRYGITWKQLESKGQVPLQGPFVPIPARTLLELVNRDFTIEREVGIGISAGGDEETTTGWGRHRRRLFAIRARPKA